jgi:hypothetical protein
VRMGYVARLVALIGMARLALYLLVTGTYGMTSSSAIWFIAIPAASTSHARQDDMTCAVPRVLIVLRG